MDFELKNKAVLVTGASSGIGRATALAYAKQGARLVLTARREREGGELAALIRDQGGQAMFVPTDVRKEADIRHAIAETVRAYGRIDVAFNNAGIDGVFSPLVEQTNENYEQVMGTNVQGVFWSLKYQIEAMLDARNGLGGGAIVNNASMGSFIGFQNAATYVATKHAVLGLTRTAALEYFPRGLRINAVCPGLIDTPFQDRVWGDDERKGSAGLGTPARRMGRAEEIADAVLFLSSPGASFISGHGLVVDGGYIVQ